MYSVTNQTSFEEQLREAWTVSKQRKGVKNTENMSYTTTFLVYLIVVLYMRYSSNAKSST
jgi:hypothetical protein